MTARTNKELKTFQMDAILNVFIHSHQDTVVALDALSKHGAVTFSRRQKTTLVTIQSTGSFSQKFQVENSNRLLLQQVPLPDIPGDYTISVSGEGCVHAQVRCWEVMGVQLWAFFPKMESLTLPTCTHYAQSGKNWSKDTVQWRWNISVHYLSDYAEIQHALGEAAVCICYMGTDSTSNL